MRSAGRSVGLLLLAGSLLACSRAVPRAPVATRTTKPPAETAAPAPRPPSATPARLLARAQTELFWRHQTAGGWSCEHWALSKARDGRTGQLEGELVDHLQRTITFRLRYSLLSWTLTLRTLQATRWRRNLPIEDCASWLRVRRLEPDGLLLEDGSGWYLTAEACQRSINSAREPSAAAEACRATIAHFLAQRLDPATVPFSRLLREGGALWLLNPREGRYSCERWQIQRAARGSGTEIVHRYVDQQGTRHHVSMRIAYADGELSFLGLLYGKEQPRSPREDRSPTVVEGDTHIRCGGLGAVQPANAEHVLVNGQPWYLTQPACEEALRALQAAPTDTSRVSGRPGC